MKEEAKKPKNENMNIQRIMQRDEFYTQMTDIEKEMEHYWHHFEGKVVYCNCDDPRVSNFFKYFAARFEVLKLKKLITTCYKNQNWDMFSTGESEKAIKIIYKGTPNKDGRSWSEGQGGMTKVNLKGDGDFRSKECVELLKESDIVVTNPPFSLFREFVEQLMLYNKKFVIVGNPNAITYKEIFPLIKENKIWLGTKGMGQDMYFDIPEHYKERLLRENKEGSGYKTIDGVVKGRTQGIWFTNLPHKKRNEELILNKWYEEEPEFFPKYDNYDAIEVSKVADIPRDYKGLMGVPISFMDKFNPNQFEIVGLDRYVEGNRKPNSRMFINRIEIYARIIIKHRNPVDYDEYYRDLGFDPEVVKNRKKE